MNHSSDRTHAAIAVAVLMFGSGAALAACSTDDAAPPPNSAASLSESTVPASSVTAAKRAEVDEQHYLCGLNAVMTLAGGYDLDSISGLWSPSRDDCVGIALQGGACWPRAKAAMWALVALGNRAESLARQWDPDALPGLSEDPQAAIWYDVASDATLAAGRYIDYGCDGGDPPDPPSRSQCYPLYDIIQRHRDLAREYLTIAGRHRQNATDMRSIDVPRSVWGETLADLMEFDMAQAASRLRDDALALQEFAERHQNDADDLLPYSC